MGEPSPLPPHPALTRRQNEVAALVAAGLTDDEIAAALCITYRTVRDHLDEIAQRLGMPDSVRRALIVAVLYQDYIARAPHRRRVHYLFTYKNRRSLR